jgi:phage gp36-like protein
VYCSVADVRLALTPAGVATDDATGATLNDDGIEDAIAEASGTVDAYIATRYTIEMDGDVATAPVRYWTRTIAAYLAHLTQKRNRDVVPDDPIRLRYTATIAMLEAVRDGKANLPLEPAENDDVGEGAIFNLYPDPPLFDMEDVGLHTEGVTMTYRLEVVGE